MQTGTSDDCTDSIIMITTTHGNNSNMSRRSGHDDDKDNDNAIDHRLPSPHEQCLILASKYDHFNEKCLLAIVI